MIKFEAAIIPTSFSGSLIFPPKRERKLGRLGGKMRDPGKEVALIHFLSDVFVAVIVVLKLPIRTGEIAELGRLLTKTPSKGALVRRRALIESLRYLCQDWLNSGNFTSTLYSNESFFIFCCSCCFLCLIFYGINIFNRGRISSVGRGLDCRGEGRGFDSRGRSITQGLKITEKIRYSLCNTSRRRKNKVTN